MNMLIKYYPLLSEVLSRVVPLLKGDKSQENLQHLESALKDMQKGMRETETWLLKREKEILLLRLISIISLVVSVINSVLLAVLLSRIVF